MQLQSFQVQPGSRPRLADTATTADAFEIDREEAEKTFKHLRRELAELQNCFYAEGRQKLLIVLQAMDAGGKDSTIRKVFRGVNPQGVRVTSFKQPTPRELGHDFLWRVHKAVPASGMLGVFNRSHYEDVLVVRVDHIVDEPVWRSRYRQINDFEKLLADTGTRILKFYLHISPEEQKARLQARLDDPAKHWKFDVGDLRKRTQWDAYMQAYEDMLHHCSTDHAPWYVVPADQKWFRNLVIARTIVSTIKDMDPQYPPPQADLAGVTIPD